MTTSMIHFIITIIIATITQNQNKENHKTSAADTEHLSVPSKYLPHKIHLTSLSIHGGETQ